MSRNPAGANFSANAASVGAMDRLGAAAGDAPAREIEPRSTILDAPHAQVVGEVRREADGGAMRVIARSHSAGRLTNASAASARTCRRGIERAERHADQPHVVIQRQPADADVVGAMRRPPTVRGTRRCSPRRCACVQRHAFRRRGRSGRELHERDVVERRVRDPARSPAASKPSAHRTSARSGHRRAQRLRTTAPAARLVTTARAPEARRIAAVSSR